MPLGPVMTMAVLEEFMAAAPISMAPGLTVVTAGTVRLLTLVALLAVLAAASRGLTLLTPV
jgi:hypothetical protein